MRKHISWTWILAATVYGQSVTSGHPAPAASEAAGQGTAAQFHERLVANCKSGKTQCVSRTSPKIANPQATQSDLPINMAVLRNQKQNADREAQEMQTSFGVSGIRPPAAGITADSTSAAAGQENTKGAMGGPQIAPTGAKGASGPGPVQNSTITSLGKPSSTTAIPGAAGGKVIPVPTQNSTVPLQAGRNGAPQGALKTENATGSGSPGSPAQANVAVQPCPQPTISTISGYPGATFSPILIFNPYTIKGCGFGNQMGHVYLTGSFYAGKIPLTVLTTPGNRGSPGRASWSDTGIVVSVDPKLSGELNQQNVALVVEPLGGAPIQKAGNEFLAFYEDVTLAPIPQSAVTFFKGVVPSVGGKKTTSPVNTGNTTSTTTLSEVSTPDPVYITPSQTGMSAEVFREGMTSSLFLTGSDLFDLSGLTPSFQPLYFQLQHNDPTGCRVAGSWNAAWEGQKVRITWEEFLCHWEGMTAVGSDYSLSVVVKGPRGINPWNGQRLLSVSPVRALPR